MPLGTKEGDENASYHRLGRPSVKGKVLLGGESDRKDNLFSVTYAERGRDLGKIRTGELKAHAGRGENSKESLRSVLTLLSGLLHRGNRGWIRNEKTEDVKKQMEIYS